MENTQKVKVPARSWAIVICLGLTSGLIGLDRFAVAFMAEPIMAEFNMNNTQLGLIVALLAVSWGITSIFMGNLSDKIGRKKVLVPSIIVFSAFSAFSGLAQNLVSLGICRVIMGIGEGPAYTTAQATVFDVMPPERRGIGAGVLNCCYPLFGIAIGSLITTALMLSVGWRYAFFIIGVPGIILAVIFIFLIKKDMKTPYQIEKEEYDRRVAAGEEVAEMPKTGMGQVFKYKNLWILIIISILYMAWLYVFSTYNATYLATDRGFDLATAGTIMSAWGFGGFFGHLCIPTISDFIGRKKALGIFSIIGGLTLLWYTTTGPSSTYAFVILFISSWCSFGCWSTFMGVATPEAVPRELGATAVGAVICIGELLGAVIFPIVIGALADAAGLLIAIYCAAGVVIIAGLLALFALKETAPKVLARKEAKSQA